MLIGLSGYARVGKDTVAKTLVEQFNFKQIAYADILRKFLYEINPYLGVIDYSGQGYIHIEPVYLQDVIDKYGWNNYKETEYKDEIRRLIQRTGTEAGRGLLGNDIWVNATLNNITYIDTVITDVRFPNEADAIRSRGGQIWRIERPDFGPINDHPSETSMDKYTFDLHILNDGDLKDLADAVSLALPS